MPDNNSISQPGAETAAILDLSGRIRNTAFILSLVVAFIFLVSFVYRPAITDDDLFNTIYSSTIARKIVQQHDTALTTIFQSNLNTFDSPYDSYARGYIAASNEDLKTKAILRFLNHKTDAQRQYVLLLIEDGDIKRT